MTGRCANPRFSRWTVLAPLLIVAVIATACGSSDGTGTATVATTEATTDIGDSGDSGTPVGHGAERADHRKVPRRHRRPPALRLSNRRPRRCRSPRRRETSMCRRTPWRWLRRERSSGPNGSKASISTRRQPFGGCCTTRETDTTRTSLCRASPSSRRAQPQRENARCTCGRTERSASATNVLRRMRSVTTFRRTAASRSNGAPCWSPPTTRGLALQGSRPTRMVMEKVALRWTDPRSSAACPTLAPSVTSFSPAIHREAQRSCGQVRSPRPTRPTRRRRLGRTRRRWLGSARTCRRHRCLPVQGNRAHRCHRPPNHPSDLDLSRALTPAAMADLPRVESDVSTTRSRGTSPSQRATWCRKLRAAIPNWRVCSRRTRRDRQRSGCRSSWVTELPTSRYPRAVRRLAAKYCSLNVAVMQRIYDGEDHDGVVDAAADDVLAFISARYSHDPATTDCT